MNCRSAQRLLSAERDGALATEERADLAGHLAACGECRQFQARIGEIGDALKTASARLAVPDEERAWQDIHREIRAARPAAGRRPWWSAVRWALPLGAAAAVAAFMASGPRDDEVLPMATARAEFVEVSGDASSVVYVDDKSGWLVVWAEPAAKGG